MFHHSAHGLKQAEARRYRRFSFANRSVFTSAVAICEGVGCAMALWVASWLLALAPGYMGTVGEPNPVAALIAGAIYAAFAYLPAEQALSSSGMPRHVGLKAALALLVAAGGANLLHPVWHDGTAAPGLGWGELVMGILALPALRSALYGSLFRAMRSGRIQIERIALVGRSDALKRFQKQSPPWQRGAQVIATYALPEASEPIPPRFVRSCVDRGCKSILFVGDFGQIENLAGMMRECQRYALDIIFTPVSPGIGTVPPMIDVVALGPNNSIRLDTMPLGDLDRLAKRAMDVLVSLFLLIALLPLLVLVAIAIKLTSSGSVLYRQERRGFNGREFLICKFRSMTVTEDGRSMTPARSGDPRITPLGRFLRRSSIDELPQLLNVLKGEMSLVGPRPHAIADDNELNKRSASYAARQRIKPGITGWAQVNGYRGDISTSEALEGRITHDLFYIQNWSLGFDLRILFLTAFSTRTRRNAR
jgi:putative colanic acid biosynthesis UDP-glucose lipid carrier transferase